MTSCAELSSLVKCHAALSKQKQKQKRKQPDDGLGRKRDLISSVVRESLQVRLVE